MSAAGGRHPDDAELLHALTRGPLPAAFERWRVVLEPGAERATTATEWAGALVLVECGALEVACGSGGCRTFEAGDLLALGWLPLRGLRNPGHAPARLVAVRLRSSPPDGIRVPGTS